MTDPRHDRHVTVRRTRLLLLAVAFVSGCATLDAPTPPAASPSVDETPPPSAEPAPQAPATAEPQPAPAGHPVDRAPAILVRVTAPVEEACGAAFAAPPRVIEASPDAALEIFARDMAAEIDRRYAWATQGQRRTVLHLAARTSVRSCVARYSFSERAIVLVREGFDGQREAVGIPVERAEEFLVAALAHECVHALDDQRFDLGRIYAAAPDDESLRARAMVAEGRAVHFGGLAAEALGVAPDLARMLPGGASPEGERAFTLNLTYAGGAAFVRNLLERGGLDLADRALADPPWVTHHVLHPDRWPDGELDTRPGRALAAAGYGAEIQALSELQLRARYAAADGPDASRELFASFRGGSQVLAGDTNLAVLAFADTASARRYAERAGGEAPTQLCGTLVLRAHGPSADQLLEALQVVVDGKLLHNP